MRTNIVIDDDIMRAAMRGSEFKTKREAVEAGLKLLARQHHNREVLKWEGKLHWDDSPAVVSADQSASAKHAVMEPDMPYGLAPKARAAAQTKRRSSVRKVATTSKR
jgi:antitoxin ParD1/3/4